ncbi:MAG: hypothetical protein ACYC6N_08525 [Pirellulaceae bacterium]
MAKDRNTFAKRQREMEQKRKASEKRENRNRKKQPSEMVAEPASAESSLSMPELAVLEVFRKFRMSPGQMLCFSSTDLIAFRTPLAQLTNDGLLIPEKFPGGYSLTQTGFAALRDGE